MVPISFEQVTLSNGLEVILHEDHTVPVVAVNIWYHVGSKDEEVGRTGFAHLFEHVMFEGSKHHNKTFFEPLQRAGANLNGSTTADRTNYWENLPSNYLELALWLESDRMGFLLDALDQGRFDVQRDVVKNERRQSYENRPYGMANLVLQPVVFPPPHPYSWPTIGSQEDLDAASLEDVKAFFRRFYSPSNASLAIAGDFKVEEAQRLVERYFGDLPPGPPVNRLSRMGSELRGQATLTIRDRVQLPRLYLAWPRGPFLGEDDAPLDMLSVILGDGRSARLYRKLVYEKQIARDVAVASMSEEIAGEFHIQVTAAPGHSLDEMESAVREELDRIGREPPNAQELKRAKNRVESSVARQLQRIGGFGGRADSLNFYNTFAGDPSVINTDLDRYMAVTAEDVQRVAGTALDENHVRLSVLPEKALSPSTASVDRTAMPDPAPPAGFTPPVPRRAQLSNGLRIVFLERPQFPMVAFSLVLRAGAVSDPPSRPGLAHLTASMLQEGTANRSTLEIAEEMEFLGASLSSEPAREYVTVSTETLTTHWPAALEILADVARNPTFPSKELERVRSERLVDIRRIVDSPQAIAGRLSTSLLYGLQSRYGHPATGSEQSVEAMLETDLSAQYKGHYGPQDSTLIVVGEVREEEVISRAEALFGDWSNDSRTPVGGDGEEAPEAAPTTIFLADKPGAAQSIIRAGHLTIPRHHPDYYALTLLNDAFGGQFSARLNMNLRQDKGYSYGYLSSINWFNGPSALLAGGAVQTEVTKESVVETLKEFGDIKARRPVTAQEFEDAKDGMLRALPSQFETHGQTLHQMTRLVVFDLPDDYFASYPAKVEAVTLADVHRVAGERIDDGHLKLLVVGDRAVVESGLREVGPPVVPVDYEGSRVP